MKVRYLSDSNVEESEILSDSDCDVTLKNRAYLRKQLLGLEIKKLVSSISVREVSNKIVNSDKYIIVTIYVKDIIDGEAKTACLTMKVHIVNNLKINLLIENDIMISQNMCVDLDIRTCKFEKCQRLKTPIDVITKFRSNLRRTIRNKVNVIIVSDATVTVPVAYNDEISQNRDFLFEPNCSQDLDVIENVFAHVVNSSISMIQVYNATTASVRLSRKTKLEALYENKQDHIFLTISADAHLAAENVKSWKINLVKSLVVTAAALFGLIQTFTSTSAETEVEVSQIDLNLEHIMLNNIIIYDTIEAAAEIAAVVDEFPKI